MLLLALAVPAVARPADKSKATTTAVTEDDDTNDGNTPNNVADEGDNRHPSGKDRSVEPGGSGSQGNSASDPDDDGRGPDRSNGGADKPDGPGGADLADQDGNNGCGNDDDFEDDNEGWCGANPKRGGSAVPATEAPIQPQQPEGEGACTSGTAGCDDGAAGDEGSCTPGAVGCDSDDKSDGDVGACTPGTTGCDDGDLGIDGGACDAAVAQDCSSDDGADSPTIAEGDLGEPADGGADGDVLGSEGEVEDETLIAGGSGERPVLSAAPRLLGQGVAAGGLAAIGSGAGALAATGVPAIVLALLALGGLGFGATLLRRSRG